MIFKIASVDSLIIYFGEEINQDISSKVRNAFSSIKELNDEALIEVIPSYSSIFITFDIFKYDYNSLKQKLISIINLDETFEKNEEIITIDVYYGSEVGFDLEHISNSSNLTIDEIIQLHSNKLYDVYAIGFLPGFAYLGNVDKKIAMPRLSSPRKVIPKGSVAIADTQTAVYPQNSPGGWNIIGKTAMQLFDKNLQTLSPLSMGKKIKFNSISKEEFLKQGGVL
ncbi:MAG: 5-oxoprolinase subunit PxpB [Poseidonibacter sp.]